MDEVGDGFVGEEGAVDEVRGVARWFESARVGDPIVWGQLELAHAMGAALRSIADRLDALEGKR